MLDSSQINAGKFKQNYNDFNVSQMVQKVIDMQKLEAQKKGIKLHFENLTNNDALLVNSDE